MKIYVVFTTSGVYNDLDNFELFVQKEAAEEFMKTYKQNHIEEDVDCFLYEKEVL
jgi:hypothetical protein